MGKSKSNTPETPDPRTIIPLQTAADKDAFRYQTDANRYNSYTPGQSSTWTRESVFDEAGYNKALEAWKGQNPQGTWIPGTPGTPGHVDGTEQGNWIEGTPATEGRWSNVGGAGADGNLAPTRDAFTTEKYANTVKLSDGQQKIYDANESSQIGQASLLDALTKRLQGEYSSPLDYSGVPELVGSVTPGKLNGDSGTKGYEDRMAALDPQAFARDAADASYSQATRYMDIEQGQQQKAIEARLAEQGFVPGTPGYQQAMQTFMDTNNRSRADARDRSIMMGHQVGDSQFDNSSGNLQQLISAAMQRSRFGNEATQGDFDNSRQAGAFQNTSRAQSIAELLQKRAQPLNELNSLREGTQQMIGGNGAANAQAGAGGVTGSFKGADVMGAYGDQYQALMDKYNADVQGDNATTQSIASLLGIAAMAFSDERLKTNIKPIGETPAGHTVYEYDIFGKPSKGVMAQDLLQSEDADAVSVHPSGFLQVDYTKVS